MVVESSEINVSQMFYVGHGYLDWTATPLPHSVSPSTGRNRIGRERTDERGTPYELRNDSQPSSDLKILASTNDFKFNIGLLHAK